MLDLAAGTRPLTIAAAAPDAATMATNVRFDMLRCISEMLSPTVQAHITDGQQLEFINALSNAIFPFIVTRKIAPVIRSRQKNAQPSVRHKTKSACRRFPGLDKQ